MPTPTPPTLAPDELRNDFPFRIHKDIPNNRLNKPIAVAKTKLIKWVGQTNFENTEIVDEIIFAWGHLAMHFCLLGINTYIRSQGIVVTEKAEGDTVNTYLKPVESETLQGSYLMMAREIVKDYMLLSDVEPAGIFEEAE
ncbi:MAG: hypothetical protein MUC29_03670 [Pyrinomonadaceae bacterium]|jgi:hypothetical protein|nr:hypothetical protein [Pyrinomonadaceae bacterium]